MTRDERKALRMAMCSLSGVLSALLWESARGNSGPTTRGLISLLREAQTLGDIPGDERIFETLTSAGLDVDACRAAGLPAATNCFAKCPSLTEEP
jgi:hypothetical protein